MTQYLLNAARTFIFSTAPPPPAIAGALAALELLEERPRLVAKLKVNADALRDALDAEGFDVGGSRTQIVPLVVGEPEVAVKLCDAALGRGVFAQAISPPTVPPMTSRLRLAVMASHRAEELRAAARVLGLAARAVGFDPRAYVSYVEDEAEPIEVERVARYADDDDEYAAAYYRESEPDAPFDAGQRVPFDGERLAPFDGERVVRAA
jgi:aspartate aminotransferase-like enzyme